MCTNPLIIEGFAVSCRECDNCAATYKNTWVARCVAELSTSAHAYALTLTYADVDGVPPLGARVYRYGDVQRFLKRLRKAGKKRFGEHLDLRYVIVGEKGTRFGRCHYHGVLFTSHPIEEIGEFGGAKHAGFQCNRRLNWSTWGHGFVDFQPATRKGIAYVLKYILKSRMTAKRSAGHGREGRTEWLASSYLWCSKNPPIGATWLWGQLHEWRAVRMVPRSLRIPVPGGGEWFLNGNLQKEVCGWLHAANLDHRAATGRDLAGWSTLVASVAGDIENTETGECAPVKAHEWLTKGIEDEQQTAAADIRSVEQEILRRHNTARPIWAARFTVERCGGIIPCAACCGTIGLAAVADLEQEFEFRFDQWAQHFPRIYRPPHFSGQERSETPDQHRERFRRWWLTRLRPSRGCQTRATQLTREHFARLIPLEKAAHGASFRGGIGGYLQASSEPE